MQTKISEFTESSVAKHSTSASPFVDDNFLLHMAPVSVGAFFFGSFHPNAEDQVQAQRALYKTSFVYRHFLQPGGIKVVIDEGSLTLSGKTSSRTVSLLAVALANQVMGTIKVSDETTRTEVTSRPETEDAEIRSRLQLILATDSLLGSDAIEVTVNNGQVNISGQVSSAANKIWAETLLKSVAPQGKLTFQVTVGKSDEAPKAPQSMDDDSLLTLAHARLKLIESLGKSEVRLSSQRQIITLSGTVSSGAEKELIESVVANTFGVRSFKSTLSVK
jgi:osmotically-inducible protein OsmY